MSFYQNLNLPLKVTLALLASLITTVAVIFLQHDYDNAFLQFLTALLIFLNLYLVFGNL